MTVTGRHIIGKQFMELQYNGTTDGIALQKTTDTLQKELLPQMEDLFNRYGAGEEMICINKLLLELELDAKDFANNLVAKIMDAMANALAGEMMQADMGRKSIKETTAARFMRLLIFYLRNGYLPWWSSITSSAEWHAFVFTNLSEQLPAPELAKLRAVISEEKVQQRIAVQFNEACFWELAKKIAGTTTMIANWQEDMQLLTTWLQQPELQQLFRINSRLAWLKLMATPSVTGAAYQPYHKDNNTRFAEMIKLELEKLFFTHPFLKEEKALQRVIASLKNNELKVLSAKDLQAKTGKKKKSPSIIREAEKITPPADLLQPGTDKVTDENLVYISNAGLVIVAPYLGLFFSRLGLLEANKINDPARAIALLQYMVTGENDFEEFEVVLPKILCGINLEEPVKTRYRLTANEQNDTEELLQAIITNWPVLKNTSVAGLRQSFLQREGKLNYLRDHWHLRVQQLSHDLLLDHLPWNIKMIKLSWMESILTVEWND